MKIVNDKLHPELQTRRSNKIKSHCSHIWTHPTPADTLQPPECCPCICSSCLSLGMRETVKAAASFSDLSAAQEYSAGLQSTVLPLCLSQTIPFLYIRKLKMIYCQRKQLQLGIRAGMAVSSSTHSKPSMKQFPIHETLHA